MRLLLGALAVLLLTTGAWAAGPDARTPSKKTKKAAPATTVAAETKPSAPPAGSSAMAELKKSEAALKKVLSTRSASWSPEREARTAEVRKIIAGYLDFEELSRRALGKHWDTVTPKQRDEFVATLRELIERNYVRQIHGQAEYDLLFDKEEKTGNDATVTAKLTTRPKGKKVTVDLVYKLLWKAPPGRWVAYDVITDESSMLENYRAEFNKIISKDGFDALVKRMRKKLDQKAQ